MNSPDKSIGRTFRVVFELPPARRGKKTTNRKPSRTYRNPVFLAREWKRMLDSGEYTSQAALARYLGISRARVNQMLRLLKLPPQIQQFMIRLGSREITERKLRALLSPSRGRELE